MTTDTYTINFRSLGLRTITRQLDDVGLAANRATRGIFFLQRALFVLGGAGLATALVQQLDALTNFENRLRLTTTSTANLERVQSELFDVANRSRSSFTALGEIYSRTALSVKDLGISQEETLRFTESLAKATILSGASAREANAALIQLSQGLASNRLSGDELRSVLEQLPFVADIIADGLTATGEFGRVTRGDLRELGSEGRISAEAVLTAFRNSADEIDRAFADTIPTISQALTVLNNAWLEFLDNFDDGTGASAALARAILFLADNLNAVIEGASLLALVLTTVFAARLVGRVLNFVSAIRTLGVVTATATSRLVAIRTAKAALTAATVQNTLALAANGRFRDAQTGKFLSNAAGLALLQRQQDAAALASARLAAAQAAQGSVVGQLTARYPLLGGALRIVTGAVIGLNAALFANPFTAILSILAIVTVAIIAFGDRIATTADGFVNLQDFAVEAITQIGAIFNSIFGSIFDLLGRLIPSFNFSFASISEAGGSAFRFILEVAIDTLTFIPRLVSASIEASIVLFGNLPAAASASLVALQNLFVTAFANIVNIAVRAINRIIGSLNFLSNFSDSFGGIQLIDEVNFDNLRSTATGAAADIASEASEAFNNAFNTGTFDSINAGARLRNEQDALNGPGELNPAGERVPDDNAAGGGGGGGGGGNRRTFALELANLQEQIVAERQFGIEKAKTTEIIRIQDAIKRQLTDTERESVNSAVEQIEISKAYGSVLQDIQGPQEQLIINQTALNELFAQGAINLSQYNERLRESQAAADRASGTLGGGFRAALSDSILSATQFGEAIGGELLTAIDGVGDAFVNLARTGEFSIRELFSTLFANLLKLASNQLFNQLIGGLFGVAGGGIGGGGIGGLISGFFGASGGSILPTGPGNTDTRFTPLFTRPDERIDILTPGQQAAQARMMRGGNSSPTVVQAPAPNVFVQITPDDIANALSGEAGDRVIVRGLERNSTAARATLNNG